MPLGHPKMSGGGVVAEVGAGPLGSWDGAPCTLTSLSFTSMSDVVSRLLLLVAYLSIPATCSLPYEAVVFSHVCKIWSFSRADVP